MSGAPPPGYCGFIVGRLGPGAAGRTTADVVCLAEAVDAVTEALHAGGTLYGFAERHPARRAFAGRAPAYAVPLPRGGGDVVVRHAWHGGALRGLTRDLYLPPTRAPRELLASERLRAAGVRTPQVVAYARYPAPLGLRRADVATRLVPGARDLAAVLLPAPGDAEAERLRAGWVAATAELLGALAAAGARHPDLNLKNVLLAPETGGTSRAWALDVDVVRLPEPGAAFDRTGVLLANLSRLVRSLTKWQRTRGLPLGQAELDRLADWAVGTLDLGPSTSLSVRFRSGAAS